MRSDMTPGGTFPDYELPDHTNTVRKLSDLQGDNPLILTLARGHYCPKEHQQHLELAAMYPRIAVAYTQMATIATDDHHELQEFRASVGAQWTFLSDPGRIVQQDLDIQEYTDPDHDPMIPHTLVLKPGLVIHSVYNGYWFWGRPSVVDLWHDLRAVSREIRPDWDLSTPGLRQAWDAGDRAPFHGWNRQAAAPPHAPEPTAPQRGKAMDERTARAKIQAHFDASNISVAGGGPNDDIVAASQIYADDAVLEWPQGGERVRGKANIIAFRSAYPAQMDFRVQRITGSHDLWVNEYTITYNGKPMNAVGIMEFHDGLVGRERIYFGEPWEPPAWRAQWVERIEPHDADERS